MEKRSITKKLANIALGIGTFCAGNSLIQYAGSLQDREPPQPTALIQRLGDRESYEPEQETKYAFLVAGLSKRNIGADSRFRDSLAHTYLTLQKNGYSKDNIIILDEVGESNGLYPVDGPASKEAIGKVMDYLSTHVDSNDSVYFGFISHGGRVEREIEGTKKELSTFLLPGEDIDQVELARLTEKINPEEGLFFIDSCYSGGFAEEIGAVKGRNYVAVSSTTANELTVSTNYKKIPSYYFVDALNNKEIADSNEDGKISANEAFNYMWDKRYPTLPIDMGKKYVPNSGAPQIKSTINTDEVSF